MTSTSENMTWGFDNVSLGQGSTGSKGSVPHHEYETSRRTGKHGFQSAMLGTLQGEGAGLQNQWQWVELPRVLENQTYHSFCISIQTSFEGYMPCCQVHFSAHFFQMLLCNLKGRLSVSVLMRNWPSNGGCVCAACTWFSAEQ